MGNLLVAGMANNDSFSPSGYHVFDPLGFVVFTLPSLA
jgi:hypothetical protein